MTAKDESRREYIARINRVMNYIEKHLEQSLNLYVLAGVAGFSQFHFHRIFTVITGETPGDYVQRIRLERAAVLLQNDERMTVGEIAEVCGFGSPALFSRSFRARFGATAKEYRLQEHAVYVRDGLRYRKNGQLISKNGQPGFDFETHLCSVKLNQIIFMDTKIEIKEMPEMKVVYIRHAGEFHLIGNAYGKLMKWAGPRGLLKFPETKSVTLYRDDPSVTAIRHLR
jgi:AraC family transcriptional regulator